MGSTTEWAWGKLSEGLARFAALGQAQIWMVQNPYLWEHYIPGDPGGLLVLCQSLKDTRTVIEYRAGLLLGEAKKGKLWPG